VREKNGNGAISDPCKAWIPQKGKATATLSAKKMYLKYKIWNGKAIIWNEESGIWNGKAKRTIKTI
jgi:hypothetical protein